MKVDVYVYYRVDPARVDDALRAVALSFRALHEFCGGAPYSQRRADDATTWMEVYPAVRDRVAFVAALDAAASHYSGVLHGERHVEVFTRLPPAAIADAGWIA